MSARADAHHQPGSWQSDHDRQPGWRYRLPRRRRSRGLGRAGPAVGGALATAYLSLVVLIPLAAVVAESTAGGPAAFWDAVTSPQAFAAMRFTVIVSLVVVAVTSSRAR